MIKKHHRIAKKTALFFITIYSNQNLSLQKRLAKAINSRITTLAYDDISRKHIFSKVAQQYRL